MTCVTQIRSVIRSDPFDAVGCQHITRPEDWPVMPAERAGFMLKPAGFFDRNPALDVAPSPSGHC